MMFLSESSIMKSTWQAFERNVARLLLHEGYEGVRIVGQTGDKGADIIAQKYGKRWLFQVKHWKIKLGVEILDETLGALLSYRAQIPVIISLSGFDDATLEHQRVLLSRGVPIQLWDINTIIQHATKLKDSIVIPKKPRPYQETAIQRLLSVYFEGYTRKALIVLATGLGKTFVVCDMIRRLSVSSVIKVLVISHTNPLVYQIERMFFPFLKPSQSTLIWNGYEHPSDEEVAETGFVFACLNSISDHVQHGGTLPRFDIVIIDECHHVGAQMYESVLEETRAGSENGPFLIGLTATPWRPDASNINDYFGEPLVCVDIVSGLKQGFLSNVDYRMFTDNINWDRIKDLQGSRFTPKEINRMLFINQWDDAVVYALRNVWNEQRSPRVIVFCGTIDHAITMRDRINSLGFCNAAAIYSETKSGRVMGQFERNRILCDFSDGTIDAICVVDIFNEGVDIPDVNIIVFQRVTHSRRIFVQQLGRGLRISPDKQKVIVLDFVSDIRRFAAGLELKDNIDGSKHDFNNGPVRINLPHRVTFQRLGGEDPDTESFLRQWIEDISTIEGAGEDVSVLKYPPRLPGSKI